MPDRSPPCAHVTRDYSRCYSFQMFSIKGIVTASFLFKFSKSRAPKISALQLGTQNSRLFNSQQMRMRTTVNKNCEDETPRLQRRFLLSQIKSSLSSWGSLGRGAKLEVQDICLLRPVLLLNKTSTHRYLGYCLLR